ncbi:shematrin-like protein 1 [Melitaea cinxia]|uniref:shematrin-like protein 1 n=1 Tax=Melitaea cinxia TaxID=113334 RepID=UPI001E270E98|nr:shematrin-like protein 1 [Melitaea cinxia]
MSWLKYLLLIVAVSRNVISENEEKFLKNLPISTRQASDDLNTASSSYSHQYSDWGGRAPGGYGFAVTGFGTIEDTNSLAPREYDIYNDSPKNYGYAGYNNLGYSDRAGLGGYDYGVYKGPGGKIPNGYISNNFGPGYGSSGYVPNGFGPSGHSSGVYNSGGYGPAGYEGSGYTGNGGYGGYGGNGGLASYSGYNNPYYQGGGHLGYGYYKKSAVGNIYSSGVTPSLVTGYRGYTRR